MVIPLQITFPLVSQDLICFCFWALHLPTRKALEDKLANGGNIALVTNFPYTGESQQVWVWEKQEDQQFGRAELVKASTEFSVSR